MQNQIDLTRLDEQDLLKTRLCDLGLTIEDTWLQECIGQLYNELNTRAIVFQPSCYLADEWLTPEDEPVVGVAFFLAHPRLMELEKTMMHEVEGGTKDSCMKLLRHETGHALNYAYQLYKRKRWKQLFGRFNTEYPDRYKYRPYSKSFVIHLEDWYAQYHPDEDFAETFAVWLNPQSDWKKKYAGWKALGKLEYVDTLMREIAHKAPIKKTGKKYWNISTLKTTLKTYYKRKTEFYAEYSPGFHDEHLKRIFSKDIPGPHVPAHKVLTKYKKDIVNQISFWTSEKKHIINQLLKNLINRTRELHLEGNANESYPILKITAYITAIIMNYIYIGRFKREK